ncbi:hypothetical protein RchiOBHm_Chr1g0349721 [Rosa chinensis]|uniref:Uncharacterized protein n=1 Tax=Rosa chinensis TaxID=74649 RepID=A0A2P6SFW5_ROSCH|nr:hypothetical protein RchiOBHm_Chr1g0349721 [Rosa chinensis]
MDIVKAITSSFEKGCWGTKSPKSLKQVHSGAAHLCMKFMEDCYIPLFMILSSFLYWFSFKCDAFKAMYVIEYLFLNIYRC